MKHLAEFTRYLLADGSRLFVGELPSELRFTPAKFDALWQMQPTQATVIQMHGRMYETNLAWTHAVPALRRYTGQRISITLRAFVKRSGISEP